MVSASLLMRTRFLGLAAPAAAAAAAACIVSCHAAYKPFEVADSCACAIDHYCRISRAAPSAPPTTECLPIPPACDPPSCSCVGRRVDACREELGRIWVFERRPVAACDDCSGEEYCLSVPGPAREPQHACGLLPPQCEGDDASCGCLARLRLGAEATSCAEHGGRIELSLASPSPSSSPR